MMKYKIISACILIFACNEKKEVPPVDTIPTMNFYYRKESPLDSVRHKQDYFKGMTEWYAEDVHEMKKKMAHYQQQDDSLSRKLYEAIAEAHNDYLLKVCHMKDSVKLMQEVMDSITLEEDKKRFLK
jgi:hypothetical protein